MASIAAPKRPKQPLCFPHAPVVTQHLSSTQATSTFTRSIEAPVCHSPAITALRKVSKQVNQSKCPAQHSSSSKMARDNGKRGSYRHASGSQAKQTDDHVEHEHDREHEFTLHTSPIAATNSPTDSNISPPMPTNFKNLNRDMIDDLGLLSDGFFDHVPSSFNAKYPIMDVPGSMPRRNWMSPQAVDRGRENGLTWTQMAIAGGVYGFALFGFLFTMYSGFSAIIEYIWVLVAELFSKVL